jgi:mycothiol synthase
MQVDNVGRLDAGQVSAVLALSAAAESVDLVAPLSEQVLLAVRGGSDSGSSGGSTDDPNNGPTVHSTNGSRHFLAYAGTHLAGYAHLERGPAGEPATAEVVVEPAARRQGVGTALVRALEDALATEPEAQAEAGALRIWSHGDLDGARAFARRDGYANVRELWAMRRSLISDVAESLPDVPDSMPDVGSLADVADSLPDVTLPEGFRSRHFVVGQDEDAWLRVNARAFADHAEQGRMTRHDLDQRIAEPWFDATGFILIEDTRSAAPVLAASHWTKVVPRADPEGSPAEGEVYVVGVDPAYQGLGLGRAVTVLGLGHLRDRGLSSAMLYVDADNEAAVATYTRLGFARFAVDLMYSRAVHLPVPR